MGLMIFDNRDSYTYNLVESFRKLGVEEIEVITEDSYDPEKLANYDRIVLGPGPGLPSDHPVLFNILESIQPDQLLLGICLGHEALALHYGGRIGQLNRVFHGDVAEVSIQSTKHPVFMNIPNTFEMGLYHSWIVDETSLPDSLDVNCRSELGLIMGLNHKTLPQYGFQFHPESYRSPFGLSLLINWYNLI